MIQRAESSSILPRLGRLDWLIPRWTDLLLAAGLAVLSVALHWPFRTRMLYAWDSVLFAYALDDFNVVAHQPQPPGYLFYVLTAWLIRASGGLMPNDAYVTLSSLAVAGTVVVLFLAGRALFGRAVGLVAAGLAASSVAFLVYAGVAYPYTSLALGSALLGWLAWRLRQRPDRTAWPAGLIFGLITGFRQDLALLLGPLFLMSLGLRSPRRLLAVMVAGAVGVLSWLVPTVWLSGGLIAYWTALTAQASQVERDTSVLAQGWSGLLTNGRLLLRYVTNTLYLGLGPIAIWAGHWLLSGTGWRDPRSWHLALWALPAMLVYGLLHLGEIGYVFSLLPPACLAAARGLDLLAGGLVRWWRWPTRRPLVLMLLAAIPIGFNLWWFLLSRQPLSAYWLGCKDQALANAVARVTTDAPAATTLIVTDGYFQHVRYYLPGYPVLQHQPFVAGVTRQVVPPGIERVIVFDWALEPTLDAGSQVTPLGCNAVLISYRVAPGDIVVVSPPRVGLIR